MVRAAAKNHPSVAVVTDPSTYDDVLDAVRGGGFTLEQRKRLAAQAFVHTATYDVHVASWMGNAYTDSSDGTGFPAWVGATWERATVLRYGENPHQHAALYTNGFQPQPALAQATQLHGKEMSYNNYVDADAAVRAAYDHGDLPTVAVIKHANPCGIAVGTDIADAHRKAHECDPVSAFGGIIATNRPVTVEMARTVRRHLHRGRRRARRSTPTPSRCSAAKKNIRLLECAAPVPRRRRGAADRRRPAHAAARRRGCRGDRRRRRGHRWRRRRELAPGLRRARRRGHPRRPRSSPGARSAR